MGMNNTFFLFFLPENHNIMFSISFKQEKAAITSHTIVVEMICK